MKITILGARGFIGSALYQKLKNGSNEVIALYKPDFDLNNPATYHCIPPDTDVIIHAAGHVGVSPRDEIIWETNVQSTYTLARHLNENVGLHRLVYLSSGAVYGMQTQMITAMSPVHPNNLYGLSKFLAEQILTCVLAAPTIILRLFFPFGPGQHLPRLMPSLIHKVMHGMQINISPSGGPWMNPLYIDNLTRLVIELLSAPARRCYNIGGDETVSLQQIAECIGHCVQKDPLFSVTEERNQMLACVPDYAIGDIKTVYERIEETVGAFLGGSAPSIPT